MAQAIRSGSSEYWRPAKPEVVRIVEPTSVRGTCWRCGTEYSTSARFCHMCGSERDPRTPARTPLSLSNLLDPATLRRQIGLSLPCLLMFAIALACSMAAVLTATLYSAENMTDWQAIQIWRIEWLLGAMVALLAGILLKRRSLNS